MAYDVVRSGTKKLNDLLELKRHTIVECQLDLFDEPAVTPEDGGEGYK